MHNRCTRKEVTEMPVMKEKYDEAYPAYQPDPEMIRLLQPALLNKEITIVMGTWCSDSRLEVSHFYKVMDEAGVNDSAITLICVDETKRAEDGSTDDLKITNVPTFIVSENHKETGRITESPTATLESDLVRILTKN